MRAAASASDLLDDREFAVPRELVFEAWTVPEHFARWFGPGEGWRQSAERLAEYLEHRSTSWPG
ncbi:MAG TPA: SRPBCC domain-containing protein [Kofleriaceae bacterium]|jgi:uncharacterized protein YndB with AHSA1/START domain|nr:SRPBCC domain-containing protein [Kofleriaceae bacterium]